MELRPYQKHAILRSVRGLLSVDRLAIIMPTGSGKTIVASQICKMFEPVLWVAHQNELLRQADSALKLAGVQHDMMSAFASDLPEKRYMLLVIDECHHEGCNTYTNLLDKLKYNKLLGMTATPSRLDGLKLRFDKKIDATNQRELVENGYSSPIKLFRVRSSANYIDDLINWANCYAEHLGRTIFFTRDLADAKYVTGKLRITSEIISGNTNRALQLEKFRTGVVQCLVSCQVLTEGVDLPMCKTVVLGRPTKSKTLLSQMIGRAVRVYEGKRYCNVVEAAPLYAITDHARVSTIVMPDEEYISTVSISNSYKTRKIA
jgi:superfamily II DNA or RNA helicase